MFLIDTNVLSELRKVHNRRTDPAFAAWASKLQWVDMYVSAITIHEVEVGILHLAEYDAPQSMILRHWFETQVLPKLATQVLPVTTEISLRAAPMRTKRTRSTEDVLIAATALVHGLTIVTRDRDFEDLGIPLINPWQA
jgi:predicted nucleic acid-binding protein